MTFHPFAEHRPIRQYLGQSGSEIGGLALSPMALEAHAESVASGRPCELVIIGYDEPIHACRDKGRGACLQPCQDIGRIIGPKSYRYAVSQDYIEATSDYRHHDGRLRLLCPSCHLWGGAHTKGCDQS